MTSNQGSPAIVFKSTYKVHNQTHSVNGSNVPMQYEGFITYMDREDAKMDLSLEENTYFKGDSIINYVGDKMKTNNVFNSYNYNLSSNDIEKAVKDFNTAQKNKSPMWQNIYSFDNQFLKEKGFLLEDGTLNDKHLKDATIASMAHFIERNKFNDTVRWVGAIHYNTDNIHIHVALVELETSRQKIDNVNSKYHGQFKAKIPKKILKTTKSKFASHFMERTNELHRMDELSRKVLKDKVSQLNFLKKWGVNRELQDLLKQLPENTALWKYGNNVMQPYRKTIDEINLKLINKHAPKEFEELTKLWKDAHNDYLRIYGNSSEYNYYKNKKEQLFKDLGNQLLKEMKEMKLAQSNKQIKQNLNHLDFALERNLKSLKFHLRKNKQDFLNEQSARKLKQQKEKDLQQEYGHDY